MQKKQKTAKWKMCLANIFTGLANGLFGSGGGMLAVVVLERMHGLETEKAHATALMVMLPLSVISLAVYIFRGALEWGNVPFVVIGMLPGSFLGAKLLGNLKSVWINRIFCILMLIAGLRLVFG